MPGADPDSDVAGRVLFVDDDDAICEIVTRYLGAVGLRVESTTNPTDALQLIGLRCHDVIISDISMPGMTGLDLMAAVREVDLDIPIILLTGTPTLSTAQDAVGLGAFRYLTKPVDKAELQAAVQRAVAAHAVARLKRDALALASSARSLAPGDLAGDQVRFDRALSSLWMAAQPIVRTFDGRVHGYELLMRSEEPALPHPGAVLQAAERLDRLSDLGRVVRTRSAAVIDRAPPSVLFFVNLHPQDLHDDTLYLSDDPLARHAQRVVLEVTERATMGRSDDVARRIAALRGMGYRVAIDDLGAGYAGLNSFAQLEPDVVKLDMELTRDIHTCPTRQRIVSAMIRLCREMGAQIVAEGVETLPQRNTLVNLGCDLAQGYLIARPDRPFPAAAW